MKNRITVFETFIFFYLLLYIFPFPINYLFGNPETVFNGPFDQVALFLGKNIFNLQDLIIQENTGSGDTALFYLKQLSIILVALIGCCLTLPIRSKIPYLAISYLVVLNFTRLFLAFNLIFYGLAKLPLGFEQFTPPLIHVMVMKIGDLSPMNLLWLFFGYSSAFTQFIGFAEILAGVLLLTRRKLLLTSLISFILLFTVVLLNFCYNIPVKLFSINLLLMLLIVCQNQYVAIFDFLIREKFDVPLKSNDYLITGEIPKRFHSILTTLVVLSLFSFIIRLPNQTYPNSKNHLDGMYLSMNESINSNQIIWESFIIGNGRLIVYKNGDAETFFEVIKIDKNSIHLKNISDDILILNFTITKDDILVLTPKVFPNFVPANYLKKSISEFPLMKRGFDWIIEDPSER